MKKILIFIAVISAILVTPLIYKDRSRLGIESSELKDLKYEEITFYNSVDNIKLAGMKFIPENTDSFPMAIIIHGSGPSFRGNSWYLAIAEYLQANGIGVILPDKRGSEKSEGEWIGADFDTLANDTIAAIEYVKNDQSINYSKIGIVGMSQGGWIAPLTASKTDDVSFIVSISGATVTTNEQLQYEEIHNIAPYTYTWIAKLIAPISAKIISTKPWVKAHMNFDPFPIWKKIKIPVFLTFGEGDKNISVEQSITRIEEIDNNHLSYSVYPAGGHAIREPNSTRVSPKMLEDVREFIMWKMD